MTIAQSMLPEFDIEMANTRKVLALIPEDNATWKPHQKSFEIGKLALHVATLPDWLGITVSTTELDLAQHVDQSCGEHHEGQGPDVEDPAHAPQERALLDLPLPRHLEVVDGDGFAGSATHGRGGGRRPRREVRRPGRRGATLPATTRCGAVAAALDRQRAAAFGRAGLRMKVRARWFQWHSGHTSTT